MATGDSRLAADTGAAHTMEVEGLAGGILVVYAGVEASMVGMRSTGKPGPLANSSIPLRRRAVHGTEKPSIPMPWGSSVPGLWCGVWVSPVHQIWRGQMHTRILSVQGVLVPVVVIADWLVLMETAMWA